MIRLLQVVTDLSFVGGDHVYIRKLLRYLARQHAEEFELHLAELRDHASGDDLSVYDELRGIGVKLHPIQPSSSSYLAFVLPRFLANVIATERIDVVHTHIFVADLAAAACRLGSNRFLREVSEAIGGHDVVLDRIIRSGITDLSEIYLDMLPVRGGGAPIPFSPQPFGWISTKHLGALKSVCQEQDLENLFKDDASLRDRGYRLNSGLQRLVSTNADTVVTISKMASQLWRGTNSDVRLIPVACIGDEEWKAIKEADTAQSSMDCPTLGVTYAFVGRLARKKNPLLLIKAFLQHLERHPDDKLIIIGDGRLSAACRSAAESFPQVEFAGHVPAAKVIEVLAKVDALCLFSSEEGLPLVVQEAMASSLPVLSSRAGGIPDLVLDGVSGLLLDDVNEKTIVGVLDRFSDLAPAERAQMGLAARKTIETWISEEAAFEKYVAAYRENVAASGLVRSE